MPRKVEHNGPDWTTFAGYTSPNYTPVPDELFDEHLSYLSGAEIKVLLYIIRRTFGFKKDSDAISLSQMLSGIERRDGTVLDRGVGLSKKTLLQALRDLQGKNLIITERRQSPERGNEPTSYGLNMASSTRGGKSTPPLGEKVHQGGGGKSTPSPRGNNSPTQETVLQEFSPSNIRKAKTSQSLSQDDGPISTAPANKDSGGETMPASSAPEPAQNGPENGLISRGEAKAMKSGNGSSTGNTRRQKAYPDERQQILSYIQDFARELGDEAPLPSSVSRAYNLWQKSGIPIEAFCTLLYEARTRTWEATANIKKLRQIKDGEKNPWGPEKNRMAFFYGILEESVERHAPKRQTSESPGEPAGDGGASARVQSAPPPPAGDKGRQRRKSTTVDTPESAVAGVSSVGEILATRAGKGGSTGPRTRHNGKLNERETIASYISRYATEFHDEAPLQSSITRAYRLYVRSGLPLARFLAHIFEAEALTTEYSATITKRESGESGAWGPEKNRMPYFLAALERRIANGDRREGVRHD